MFKNNDENNVKKNNKLTDLNQLNDGLISNTI